MIEKTSHRIWIQGRHQLPDHLADMCAGFDRLHQSWSHEWWDNERILDSLDLGQTREIYLHAADHVPADAAMQMRADIARYAILRQHGGLYIDVDYRWLKPIDQLIAHAHAHAVACYEIDNSWVANGFLATTRDHPLMIAAVQGIPANLATNGRRGLRANTITGPKYLTPLIRQLPAEHQPRLLPAAYLHAIPWHRRYETDAPDLADKFPLAYAAHTWDHRRRMDHRDDPADRAGAGT